MMLCADLAIFPLPILRYTFMEESCFRIVYDTVRNYGILIKNVSGSYFVAQNVEISRIFFLTETMSKKAVLLY